MRCVSCGYELPEGSRFCTECGALQQQKKRCPCCKTELNADAKFCVTCGAPQPKFCLYCNSVLPLEAKFCMQCGTKVRDNPVENCEQVKIAYTYNFTFEPEYLEEGTDGSAGTKGEYVLFGDWPQTIKSEEVVINDKVSFSLNGWECFKGSDGCCYVKETVESYNKDIKFSNGEKVIKGKSYYFKLEPIKWRILDNNYNGGKLLLAENGLITSCFDTHGNYWNGIDINRKLKSETVFPNNYEYSTIRAYLNSLDGSSYDVENFSGLGFIDKAFSPVGKSKIKKICVDNGESSIVGRGAASSDFIGEGDKNPYKYVCKNTNDKVFLLSEKEVTELNYGFDICKGSGKKTLRCRKACDFALSGIEHSESTEGFEYKNWWWLRSPYYYTSAYASGVTKNGSADYHCIVCNGNGLVVPALVI